MRRSFSRAGKFILTFLFVVVSFALAKGAQPVVHISARPTWLSICKPYNQKPSLRTVEDGYYFSIIEHQVHIEKQADYRHNVREIISETGIQNGSQISVSFDPTYERLDFHDITVWRNNKPQNRLKAPAFKVLADEKDLSNFIYQGTYSALCILDDIRKGDRIEYSYTITGRNPIFNNKYSSFLYLQYYQTVAHQYTAIMFSAGRKINMKLFNNAASPVISQANGLKKYEWEGFQIKPALYDENAPSWYDARDYIQLSDYNSWAEVTDWARGINPAQTNIQGELAEEIARLKSLSGNNKEKYFRNAVKIVQDEVRYMGIELGPYSHRANNPAKVFAQRYGDCKDKSLLLVSMLRADGIDANMVLINSGGDDLDKCLPAHNLFDHAVVVAQINGKPVWVDATIAYQRGTGANIYFPGYSKGLILKPGNTGLTKANTSKAGRIVCVDSFTVKNAKSPVQLQVKTTYTLNQADRERDRLASSGMAETEKSYLKYYSEIYNKIEAKDSVVVIDNEEKNELTTIEKYEITDYFKKDSVSGDYSASFYANPIKEELPKITNQTKTPVAVNGTFDEDYTVKMFLPAGWDITPKTNEIKRDGYEFTSDYSSSGKVMTLDYSFKYLKSFVPVNKLSQFREDVKKLTDNGLAYSISFNPDAAADSGPPIVNQWMLNMAMFIVLIAGFVAFRIYKTETPGIVFEYGATFVQLGGWLILLLVGLFLTPIVIVINLNDTKYFTMDVWNSISKYSYANGLKAHIIFKVAGSVILMAYSLFCLVLFLNRRDILPKYMIGYLVYGIVFRVADLIFVHSVSRLAISNQFSEAVISSVVAGAIWIPYFLKSTRVKETFIVPYPSYNYSYEKHRREELPND
ncbi:DUF3857 domain-containing protein [Mucilaginibacter sp.]|uniref:DUF3857 domain-containing protein n=1 Tax=Mucilaginibacter sp. TaxID=1882438 RepID=UPI0025F39ACB|nr:DUF3857 domain-containing protein [Mucilaginibacter sp.]